MASTLCAAIVVEESGTRLEIARRKTPPTHSGRRAHATSRRTGMQEHGKQGSIQSPPDTGRARGVGRHPVHAPNRIDTGKGRSLRNRRSNLPLLQLRREHLRCSRMLDKATSHGWLCSKCSKLPTRKPRIHQIQRKHLLPHQQCSNKVQP